MYTDDGTYLPTSIFSSIIQYSSVISSILLYSLVYHSFLPRAQVYTANLQLMCPLFAYNIPPFSTDVVVVKRVLYVLCHNDEEEEVSLLSYWVPS